VFASDRAEDAGVRRIARLALASGGEAEHLEEDARDLLGRAEHELLTCELVRPGLQLLDAVGESGGDLAHPVRVDLDARVLHPGKHLGERELDLPVERVEASFGDPLPHRAGEPERRGAVANQGGGVLLGRRLRLQLDSVLGGEVVERIRRAAGLDEIRHEERVVHNVETQRLCVVGNEVGIA
jgi:hypothetical protein